MYGQTKQKYEMKSERLQSVQKNATACDNQIILPALILKTIPLVEGNPALPRRHHILACSWKQGTCPALICALFSHTPLAPSSPTQNKQKRQLKKMKY
jgi:hypothetical protein